MHLNSILRAVLKRSVSTDGRNISDSFYIYFFIFFMCGEKKKKKKKRHSSFGMGLVYIDVTCMDMRTSTLGDPHTTAKKHTHKKKKNKQKILLSAGMTANKRKLASIVIIRKQFIININNKQGSKSILLSPNL